MKRDRHIGAYFKWAVCAGILLVAGCTYDDEVATTEVMKSDVVTFGIRMSNEWKPDVIGGAEASRASAASKGGSGNRSMALPMECVKGTAPVENIYMYVVEEDCPAVVDAMSVRSRAEGDETPSTDPALGVYAFQVPSTSVPTEGTPTYNPTEMEGITPFMDNVGVKEDGTTIGGEYYWPGAGNYLQFFAYSPYQKTGLVDAYGNQPKFTYTVPKEVADQKPLLEGLSTLMKDFSNSEVPITLQHALSCIQIEVNEVMAGTIQEIRLEGIVKTGTHIMGDYDEDGKAKWTYTSTDTITYSQTIEENGSEIMPFFFIPQELGDEAKLTIVLKKDDSLRNEDGYTISTSLKDFKWNPDKKYTYRISTPEEVEIEITDEVEGNVKKNLTFKNVGLGPAFIRAMIVGNWVLFDEGSDVTVGSYHETEEARNVASWTPGNDEFDWGTEGEPLEVVGQTSFRNKWYKCEDGYYYYNGILQRNETASQLFNTYTLKQLSPVNDAWLELVIAVQGVYPEDVEAIWPEETYSLIQAIKKDNGIN